MARKKMIESTNQAYARTFDTHKHIKALMKSGFNESQAEIIIETLVESRGYDFSKLATKEQLEIIHNRIVGMATKDELKKEIAECKTDILKWIIPLMLTVIGMVATILFRTFTH